MQNIELDASRLYGFKILKDEKNRVAALSSIDDQAKIDSKIGRPKISAKIGAKPGEKNR